jgi:nucleotide sugar dehydrogenase
VTVDSEQQQRQPLRRALISVYDKTGLGELAKGLDALAVELRKQLQVAVDREREIHDRPIIAGIAVGGHCIPVDPTYLAWQVKRDVGHQFRLLEQAQDVNARMPVYVSGRIAEALNDQGKAVRGARIVVLGGTYKPDVGDIRESPSLAVLSQLSRRGAEVAFHDRWGRPSASLSVT